MSEQQDALMRLGASTAGAIATVLETLVPEGIQRGEVTVATEGPLPFEHMQYPAVGAGVRYVDGASGGNIFVMTIEGARRLAAAMMGQAEAETSGEELTELELSAVSEAANQMLAAAASAIAVVLGEEVEIDPPDTRVLATADEATQAYGPATFTTSCTFTVRGEVCRLIQLVPNTFIARITRALDAIAVQEALAGAQAPSEEGPHTIGLADALRDIRVRVWAELGRTKVGIGRAVTLPQGAVVELDSDADAPVELFVNGLRLGRGELVVTDDGEWAVRVLNLERVETDTPTMEGAAV